MRDELELLSKLLLAVILLWPIYEIRQLDILIQYPRLSKFLRKLNVALWGFAAVRLSAGILEYALHFSVGWISIIASAVFFSVISLLMRHRRQRLALEWAAVPERSPEAYNSIITTLNRIKPPHD